MGELGNVLPEASLTDESDGHLGHTELQSERGGLFSGGRASANLADLVLCEPARGGAFALTRRHALLPGHVGHVVGVCAEAQVRRVATRSVVAGVQHMKTIGDRPVRVRVRESVGVDLVAVSSVPEPAITTVVASASPRPTGIRPTGLVYAFPEPRRSARPFRKNGFHERSLAWSC